MLKGFWVAIFFSFYLLLSLA